MTDDDEDLDPFERCYVHDGGLPRVEEKPGEGGALRLVLWVKVCGPCRMREPLRTIQGTLLAQYHAATGSIVDGFTT